MGGLAAVLTIGVDRARGNLQQLTRNNSTIDRRDGGLLELHDLEVLHLVVLRVVLLTELECHGVLVIHRDVDAVLEPMSNGDVAYQRGNRRLDARTIIPPDHVRRRPHLFRDARGSAEAEERLTQSRPVIQQKNLMP